MKKLKTRIWLEKPTSGNPFAPAESYLHGADFFRKVATGLSFSGNVFFHFRGRKPTPRQGRWMDILMNLASNPGIRDESSRVAMNVTVGNGPSLNGLLAGLLSRSGADRGGYWVERVMTNLAGVRAGEIEDLGGCRPFSGLGLHFGSPDFRAAAVVPLLRKEKLLGTASRTLLEAATDEEPVLLEGLVAAGLLDLGFTSQQGAMIFLFAAAPSFGAFSLEQREFGLKEYPSFFEKDAFVYHGPMPERRK